MPQIFKMMMALLIAGFALAACGPSGGDGSGGDAATEESAPADNTTAQ
ncbi:MAG: hypothetical protein AAGF25_03965 [Pseudomonadota bacterium]